MPTHRTSAYKDDQKWVVFCEKCGVEEPFESQECSERYVQLNVLGQRISSFKNEKIPFVTGLPLDESEKS